MNNQLKIKNLHLVRWGVHAAAATALLLAAAIYYAFVVGPLVVQRQTRLADVERLEALQQAAATARQTQGELHAALASMKLREAAVRQRIPEHADEHEFLHAITNAAGEAGLHVVDYRREGVTQESTHAALRIIVKCRGGYAALCRVLERLQNHDRLIIIEQLQITSDMASDDHAIDMVVVLFYGLKTPPPTLEVAADA